MTMTVSVDDAAWVATLSRLSSQFPAEMSKAVGSASSIVRRRVMAGVRGKAVEGVPPQTRRHPVTVALHGSAMGGVLSRPTSMRIRRLGEFARYIAYIDPLSPYMARFQDGGRTGLDKAATRHAMYRMLGARGERDLISQLQSGADAVYPGRPVVPGVTESARRDFFSWVHGALAKLLSKCGVSI